jgi:hypothetical protein
MNKPLKPAEAVSLFYGGDPLSYTSAPGDPFVYSRWLGIPVVASPLPFPDREAAHGYFKAHPVYLFGDYVPPRPGHAAVASILVKGAGFTVEGTHMAVNLPLGLVVDLTVAYADAGGNAAPQPGPIAWASDNTAVCTVLGGNAPADAAAVATPVTEGTANITAVSGGVTASIAITVIAGVATVGTITAGTPRNPTVTNPSVATASH